MVCVDWQEVLRPHPSEARIGTLLGLHIAFMCTSHAVYIEQHWLELGASVAGEQQQQV